MNIKTEIIYADEFDDDAYLDVLSLGKEIFVQSSLNSKYEIYLTDLTGERDDLQIKLNYKKDTLQLEIRDEQEDFGIKKSIKLTEKIVSACIDMDDDVQDMIKNLAELNKLVGEANGALRSIRVKARSLDNAVHLYKTGYWGDLTAMPIKMQEEVDAYLNKESMSKSLDDNTRLTERNKKE